MIRVGMSGFSYPSWKGVFYPEKAKAKDFLPFYASRFGAVEINLTHRRMPSRALVGTWADAVPDAFRFAVKANHRITHTKISRDTTADTTIFFDAISVLGEKLGPVLFPLTMVFDPEPLEAFLATLPPGSHAMEPRHASYKAEEFTAILARRRVAHCLNDAIFDPSTYRVTAPFAYFRFRKGRYEPAELDARRDIVRQLSSSGVDVYVFFMHEDDPEAAMQALRFQELVGQ